MAMISDLVARARSVIRQSDALLITAGAGMGVDSGLPDFRGDEGFWEAYPVAKRLGLRFVELASPEWFVRDPALAWAFYGHRLHLYRQTVPHEGFGMLLELAHSKQDHFIFTSNVDGQFQKAGFAEDRIYECHGSIHHLQCTVCTEPIYSAEGIGIPVDMERFAALDIPLCPSCGAVARPNILMFGDWGWDSNRSDAQSTRMDAFIQRVQSSGQKLAIIEIGAGEYIPTVRHLSEEMARALEGFVIRINPRDTHTDERLGVGLAMGGATGISKILL